MFESTHGKSPAEKYVLPWMDGVVNMDPAAASVPLYITGL